MKKMTALLLAFMLVVPFAVAQNTVKADDYPSDDDDWFQGLVKDYWGDLDQWLYNLNVCWGWE